MPLTGPSHLISTIDEFLRHWNAVETVALAPGALVVLEGVRLEGLRELRALLDQEPVGVDSALAGLRLARGDWRDRCRGMHAAMKWFNGEVRADFPETAWVRCLARLPTPGDGFDAFVPPLRASARLWRSIESAHGRALVSRVLGVPAYGRAEFVADLEALEAADEAMVDAELELRLARAMRELLEERAVAVMKAYGHAVKGRLGDEGPLVESIPQLWPGPRRGERRRGRGTAPTDPPSS